MPIRTRDVQQVILFRNTIEIRNHFDDAISAIEPNRTKSINIPSNDGSQLSFLITPLITGSLTIKLTAISPIAGDAIEVTLPVVPEGVPQYKNKAKFVDLRKNSTYSTDFTVDVPANAVKDSTQVSFSLIGKHYALIQMNYSCELIRNFVP